MFYQPDPKNPDGYLLPWHLGTHSTGAQAIPDTSHAWLVQHSAWNGGKMDNRVPAHRAADGDAHGPFTMGYYEQQDLPFHPWTQRGWVCSGVSDHTSCLKFCEVVTGVPATNISAWRRNTVDTAGELQLASYTSTLPLPSIPGANQAFPVQPRGTRRQAGRRAPSGARLGVMEPRRRSRATSTSSRQDMAVLSSRRSRGYRWCGRTVLNPTASR